MPIAIESVGWSHPIPMRNLLPSCCQETVSIPEPCWCTAKLWRKLLEMMESTSETDPLRAASKALEWFYSRWVELPTWTNSTHQGVVTIAMLGMNLDYNRFSKQDLKYDMDWNGVTICNLAWLERTLKTSKPVLGFFPQPLQMQRFFCQCRNKQKQHIICGPQALDLNTAENTQLMVATSTCATKDVSSLSRSSILALSIPILATSSEEHIVKWHSKPCSRKWNSHVCCRNRRFGWVKSCVDAYSYY